MATRKSRYEKQLLEAKVIFADKSDYNEYELMGYYRLVKAVSKTRQKDLKGKIQIAVIKEIIEKLDERTYNIFRWRYWDGMTREKVGIILNISGERIRQIEYPIQQRLEFAIKKEKGSQVRWAIEKLNLNPKGYLALKRAGINTITELVKLTQRDWLQIKGIGRTSRDDIRQKLADFLMGIAPKNLEAFEVFPIDTLNFSYRVNNALKAKGILTIGKLFELSEECLYGIREMGKKSVKEILNKKQEIISKYQQS